jgi:hypothetical protein
MYEPRKDKMTNNLERYCVKGISDMIVTIEALYVRELGEQRGHTGI